MEKIKAVVFAEKFRYTVGTMIFARRKQSLWPLYFFGGIALCITLATGVLVARVIDRLALPTSASAGTGVLESSAEMTKKYQEDVASLVVVVENYQGTGEELRAFVENVLLAERVPGEMLDAHIAAVLQIRRSREKDDIRAVVRRWQERVIANSVL